MSWFCVIHSIYLVSSIFVSVKIEYDTPLKLISFISLEMASRRLAVMLQFNNIITFKYNMKISLLKHYCYVVLFFADKLLLCMYETYKGITPANLNKLKLKIKK